MLGSYFWDASSERNFENISSRFGDSKMGLSLALPFSSEIRHPQNKISIGFEDRKMALSFSFKIRHF